MCKNFRKLCKKHSNNFFGIYHEEHWLKKIEVGWHKKQGGATTLKHQMERIILCHITVKIKEIFFSLKFTKVSNNQINWLFFTQLYKLLTHFWDRGGTVSFLAHHSFNNRQNSKLLSSKFLSQKVLCREVLSN